MKQQGYNHNIRYKDVVFHVQTEDYGTEKANIVTQLFYSGMILHKEKQSYQDILEQSDLGLKITDMMKRQHKEVMKKLLAGQIDIPASVFPASLSTASETKEECLEDSEDEYDHVRNYLGTEEF